MEESLTPISPTRPLSHSLSLSFPLAKPRSFAEGQRRLLRSLYQPALAVSSETTSCWCTQHGPRITLALWNAPFFSFLHSRAFFFCPLVWEKKWYGPNKCAEKITAITIKSEPELSSLFFFCLSWFSSSFFLSVVLVHGGMNCATLWWVDISQTLLAARGHCLRAPFIQVLGEK